MRIIFLLSFILALLVVSRFLKLSGLRIKPYGSCTGNLIRKTA